MARLPAVRLSCATCSRSSGDVIKRGAAVELADDLENDLFAPVGRRMRQQQPADAQMGRRARILGNQRIGRLLDAVVLKRVGVSRRSTSPARTASQRLS